MSSAAAAAAAALPPFHIAIPVHNLDAARTFYQSNSAPGRHFVQVDLAQVRLPPGSASASASLALHALSLYAFDHCSYSPERVEVYVGEAGSGGA